MRTIAVTAVLIVLGSARAAQSQPKVDVPLSIDYATLSEALKRSVYTDSGRAQLWNGSDLCQYLYAGHPSFSRAGGRVKLESDGTLTIGVAVGSACLSPIQWKGIIETESEPYVSGKVLKLRVADINLLLVIRRHLRIFGSTLRSRPAAEKAAIVASFLGRFGAALEQGRITLPIHRVFPLADAPAAHRMMQASEHFGKIVLRVE